MEFSGARKGVDFCYVLSCVDTLSRTAGRMCVAVIFGLLLFFFFFFFFVVVVFALRICYLLYM